MINGAGNEKKLSSATHTFWVDFCNICFLCEIMESFRSNGPRTNIQMKTSDYFRAEMFVVVTHRRLEPVTRSFNYF